MTHFGRLTTCWLSALLMRFLLFVAWTTTTTTTTTTKAKSTAREWRPTRAARHLKKHLRITWRLLRRLRRCGRLDTKPFVRDILMKLLCLFWPLAADVIYVLVCVSVSVYDLLSLICRATLLSLAGWLVSCPAATTRRRFQLSKTHTRLELKTLTVLLPWLAVRLVRRFASAKSERAKTTRKLISAPWQEASDKLAAWREQRTDSASLAWLLCCH